MNLRFGIRDQNRNQGVWELILNTDSDSIRFRGSQRERIPGTLPMNRHRQGGAGRCVARGLGQKSFAKRSLLSQSQPMVQPLAIVLNDRVVIGAQLEQKLEGLDYRVKVSDHPEGLGALALKEKPLVVLMDLTKESHLVAASALLNNSATRHVPIVGYAPDIRPELQARANNAGVSVVVTDSAILQHLKQLLDQALHVE